jgi:hypothetical protein
VLLDPLLPLVFAVIGRIKPDMSEVGKRRSVRDGVQPSLQIRPSIPRDARRGDAYIISIHGLRQEDVTDWRRHAVGEHSGKSR